MLDSNLSSGEWHKAIVGGRSPEAVAAAVRNGNPPEWLNPILSETEAGDTLLELGSGTGELSANLVKHRRKTILADFSPDSLAFAGQLYKLLHIRGEFLNFDVLERFPMEDGRVDCVWSSGLLEHFSDDEIRHIISESARVACKKVISLVPNAMSIPYRLGKWYQEATKQWNWGYEDPKTSLASFFAEAGLIDIREYSIAPMHALNFLTIPGNDPIKKIWQLWYQSLEPAELERLNQGYLLVTIGRVGR